MAAVIPVAHDFLCPWCWIGWHQTKRLSKEFRVEFDWIGHELFPEELAWPEPGEPEVENPDRPKTPSRLDLAYAAEGMTPPTVARPRRMRIHNALQAVEEGKAQGVADQVVEALYKAFWEEGRAIGEEDVLLEILAPIVPNVESLSATLRNRAHKHKIVPFDDEAYAAGVYNVPTFFIGGERYAEQPYSVLVRALQDSLK